jgi:hypothetical protein
MVRFCAILRLCLFRRTYGLLPRTRSQYDQYFDLTREKLEACAAEDGAIPWIIKDKADQAGYSRVSRYCLYAAANAYARIITSTRRYGTSIWHITIEQFEESLCRKTLSETERNWVRARVYAGMADRYYWRGELQLAQQFYRAGLRKDPWMPRALAKWLLLLLGHPDDYLRRKVLSFRRNRFVSETAHSNG